jgi:hypothetical protein
MMPFLMIFRIDLGTLLQKPSNESPDSYLTQYNQQATESIKNTIGVGIKKLDSYVLLRNMGIGKGK